MIKLVSFILLLANVLLAQEQNKINSVFEDFLKNFQSVRDFTISNEGNEAYFTAQSQLGEISAIIRINIENNTISKSQIAKFSGKFNDLEPFLTDNGLRLFFVSNRPSGKNNSSSSNYDIWYVERKSKLSAWGKPVNLGKPINTDEDEFYPSLSKNNNLYFTKNSGAKNGRDDIYFSEWSGKSYSDPKQLGPMVNTNGYEFNSFIAPDESFIIFTGYNRDDGFGSGDLYISFKDSENKWQKAINMGDKINSSQMDYCPLFNAETNTLYFTSRRSNIHFPKEGFNSVNEFSSESNKYENGQSRIYKIKLEESFNK